MSGTLVRIAHRGGGSLAPENSIVGIERSLKCGVDMIEVDVRRTRDGILVLAHDAVSHPGGPTAETSTLAELRSASQDLATLEQALESVSSEDVRLNLDLQTADLAAPVIEMVRRHGATERCIVSCLIGSCLAAIAVMEPSIPRFISYPPDYGGASRKPWLKPVVNGVVAGMRATMPWRLSRMLRPLPGTHATIFAPLVTLRLIELARRMNIDLYTWTVDELPEMQRLVALGVDGITSNRPDLLATLGALGTQPTAV